MKPKRSSYVRGKPGGARSRAEHGFLSTAKKKVAGSTKSFRQQQDAILQTIHGWSFTTRIVVGMIVAVITISAFVSLIKSQLAINEKQQILDQLEARIAQQQADNEELAALLSNDDNLDPYIEAYAREKLDMVKPGERVYINTVGE